ncbi:MAG TPA: efflux RND transporter periplasmic adaptor subunit [Haliangiales bacterium]|nr:efflux RND transporter periplasmic adaptor subunit [Haliangiales bacterium]
MIKSTKLRRLKRPWLLVVLACGVGLGWYLNQSPESALRYETAVASRGELTQLVTASGQLNPVVKVEVGSQISGIIQKLLVDFNSSVKEGQVVAQLDPATYEANLIQAQGNLSNVVAALELAQLYANRAKSLQAEKLTAKADYEKAVADLHQAEAAVKISEGALKKAQVDLARCTIYAPIDGIVISRNVDVGQTVAASLSAPTLFLIANDLAKMQIEADVGEADIGMVAPGQDVEFTVDAFPGQTFHGKVTQVRNFPKTEQSVVTYVTIIDVSNPDLKLKPGMTANVSVVIARRDNALKIPTSALRFRPPKTSEAKKTDSSSAVTEAKSEKKSAETTRKKDKRKSERTIYVASASGTASAGDQTEGRPQPVQVKTGISDGSNIEVIEGLKEGDRVVIGLAKEEAGSRRTVNPFVFRR